MGSRWRGLGGAATHAVPLDGGVRSAELLSPRGASVAALAALGLPTPPGFAIPAAAWRDGPPDAMPRLLRGEVAERMNALERETGLRVGDPERPLLVAVLVGPARTGAVLDLGLDAAVLDGIRERDGAAWAARLELRFLRTFARAVRGIDPAAVEAAASAGDGAAALRAAIAATGDALPDPAADQLREAIVGLRRAHRTRDGGAPVIVVQAMVHGDRPDGRSGSGIVFSRDPVTGSPDACGRHRRPAPGRAAADEPLGGLRARQPALHADLERALALVEAEGRDMCSVDFAVDGGRLWFLRAGSGCRSGSAAIRIAVDLVDEAILDVEDALDRIPSGALERLQAPVPARVVGQEALLRATAASPGAAVGALVLDPDGVAAAVARGAAPVLVLDRPLAGSRDAATVARCAAIVSSRSAWDGEATIGAWALGRPAVCDAGLRIDRDRRRVRLGATWLPEGAAVTVDGGAGTVLAGVGRLVAPQPDPRVARVLAWAHERRAVPIRDAAPAGTPRVDGPDALPDDLDGPVLVALDATAPDPGRRLRRTVAALLDAGAGELLLELPPPGTVADLRPPAGPWRAVVAPSTSWTARLVAARIVPEPAATAVALVTPTEEHR
ncbi:hypothetical protein SK069_13965 [Patulibacter brassicae]|uniref:Pyruvate, phosphate dikinase n=1 Tax=Patulibacter brassicae TaxID=1705717 RepID=A0ABU4VLQ2_9ACTN|nr:hypothetical protein [Patulibacter brassicae]MDX8152708.1 hypothetical protein [Patulibacter brassicae]